jgi:hypothetical protein
LSGKYIEHVKMNLPDKIVNDDCSEATEQSPKQNLTQSNDREEVAPSPHNLYVEKKFTLTIKDKRNVDLWSAVVEYGDGYQCTSCGYTTTYRGVLGRVSINTHQCEEVKRLQRVMEEEKKQLDHNRELQQQRQQQDTCIYCRQNLLKTQIQQHIISIHQQTTNHFPPYKRLGRYNSQRFDCLICGYLGRSVGDIQYHLYQQHHTFDNQMLPQNTSCPFCHKTLSTKYHLESHIKTCNLNPEIPHKKVEIMKNECPYCQRMLGTKFTLEHHLTICKYNPSNQYLNDIKGEFRCTKCDYVTDRKWNLQRHLQICCE